MTLRVGVIGVGRFGKEHARVYSSLPGVSLVGVVDRHAERAREVAEKCGSRPFAGVEELIGQVDAVSVAAPTRHHFEIGRACLQRGVATLIEKPIGRTLDEAEALVRAAQERRAVLQVGHIERFNPVFLAAAEHLQRPRFIEATRRSPFRFRSADIDVVLDVMIHDLDLILSLVPSEPLRVRASGRALMFAHTDSALARIEFADGTAAHLSSSRVAEEMRRELRVVTDRAVVSIDFGARTLRVASLTDEAKTALGSAPRTDSPSEEDLARLPREFYRTETITANGREPLEAELDSFLRAVRGEAPSVVPGEHALRVMRLAAEIQREIREA
jgi:predicted dehydrogenase